MLASTDDNSKQLVVGGQLTLQFKFYTRAGVLSDPTTASLKIKDPSGAITTKALADLTKIEVGDYEYNVDLNAGGEWKLHLETTGNPKVGWNLRLAVEPALVA